MKKVMIFAVASVLGTLLTITSCKKGEEKKTENKEQAKDAPQQSDGESTEPMDEPRSVYYSIDLQTYNLRGPVKSVEEYREGENEPFNVLGFDEHGRLTKMSAYTFEGPVTVTYQYSKETGFEGDFLDEGGMYCQKTLERDEKNRIIFVPTGGFTYDECNRWKEYIYGGWEDATTFKPETFDDMGNVLKETFEGAGEGMEWCGNNTYEYTQFDDHNNWTERKSISYESMYDFDTKPETYEESTGMRRRVITYYE